MLHKFLQLRNSDSLLCSLVEEEVVWVVTKLKLSTSRHEVLVHYIHIRILGLLDGVTNQTKVTALKQVVDGLVFDETIPVRGEELFV